MNYPKFKLGDTIQALNTICFSDGSRHNKNEKFFITTSNINYFNNKNNKNNYEVLKRNTCSITTDGNSVGRVIYNDNNRFYKNEPEKYYTDQFIIR